MRLHAKRDNLRGKITDLDTGERVLGVIWIEVDGQLGTMIEAFQMRGATRVRDATGTKWLTYTAKGRFKFEPAAASKPVLLGAPRCVRCPSPLTLPGDDLCAACRASDRGQRDKMQVELCDPLSDQKCESCSRQARWEVSDEVEATPQQGQLHGVSLLFDRAAVVHVRRYCDRCWQAPRVLDARGEVVRELEREARPT